MSRPRLVLDTNVLGRAICGSAPSLDLVLRWHAGDYLLCVSAEIVAEYRRVLPKVRLGDEAARAAILDQIARRAHLLHVRPSRRLFISRHEADNRFIECAVEAEAHAMVTFNERHFPPAWLAGRGVLVTRPREYLPSVPALR